jgi:hypothetical protein
LTYGKIEGDDPIPQGETEVVYTDHDELGEALQALVDDAMIKGASIEFITKLRGLQITYHDAFRLHLGQDHPADVPPLKMELKPDAKPKAHTNPQVRAASGAVPIGQYGRDGLFRPGQEELDLQVGKPTSHPTEGCTGEVPFHPLPTLPQLSSRTGLLANAEHGG